MWRGVDAVILTGGGSKSKHLVSHISKYISPFVDLTVYPGSIELEAIVNSTLRAMRGEEEIKTYQRRVK